MPPIKHASSKVLWTVVAIVSTICAFLAPAIIRHTTTAASICGVALFIAGFAAINRSRADIFETLQAAYDASPPQFDREGEALYSTSEHWRKVLRWLPFTGVSMQWLVTGVATLCAMGGGPFLFRTYEFASVFPWAAAGYACSILAILWHRREL